MNTKLTDFMALTKKNFWKQVEKDAGIYTKRCSELWSKADEFYLDQEEACILLDSLFLDTHRRIAEYSEQLSRYYPTTQFTKNKLEKVTAMWWVDHFTAGISPWSTLNWFSGNTEAHKKVGHKGASTHFVVGYTEMPFYIVPLMHGAWHEPRRNKDSISVEMVNAGGLQFSQTEGKWRFWAREMPVELIKSLPPVILDKPYKGCKAMQPFTLHQIRCNIKLKRIVNSATGTCMDPSRMSQHSDWRTGKIDMGPLWMFDECNSSVFTKEPIEELRFIQEYDMYLDGPGEIWKDDWNTRDYDATEEHKNPEYGTDTPTHDDDIDLDKDGIIEINEVQVALNHRGYNLKVDNVMGKETKAAVMDFQNRWNHKNPTKKLKADGIPGPMTCKALQEGI